MNHKAFAVKSTQVTKTAERTLNSGQGLGSQGPSCRPGPFLILPSPLRHCYPCHRI